MKPMLIVMISILMSCTKTSGQQQGPEAARSDSGTGAIHPLMDTLLAGGFDFPVGDENGKGGYTSIHGRKRYDGWYTAVSFTEMYTGHRWIHTGEDWNGKGGGSTDLGQPVHATARGCVVFADTCPAPWGNVILIKHLFLENGAVRTAFSLYAHCDKLFVTRGRVVEKRDTIGTIGRDPDKMYPAHLHFEIRKESMDGYPADYWPSSHGKTVAWVKENYEPPTGFINTHRALTVPRREKRLLIAEKGNYRMLVFNDGKPHAIYEIALSQNPIGHKVRQGDNRLPEGEYRIIEKSRGPFSGAYAGYFGPAWIRIDYPNSFDAEAGYKKGLITKQERDSIVSANASNRIPPKGTKLGGGIGIHGWNGDWIADGTQNLTWGCISMHNDDLIELYKNLPSYTKIIITP